MILDIYTFCYNEMKIMPFILKYWKEYHDAGFLRRVFVFDNYSTDGSKEELEKYDFIGVEQYGEDNLNDETIQDIKNSCWKCSDADFVYICDFDEILWSSNLKEELQNMLSNGFTICKPKIYELISEEFPSFNDYIHKQCRYVYYPQFGKTGLFSPKHIKETNYDVGAHHCNPTGNVKWYKNENIYMFHANKLSKQYLIDKYTSRSPRRSKKNIDKQWGYQYAWPKERIAKSFDDDMKKSISKLN